MELRKMLLGRGRELHFESHDPELFREETPTEPEGLFVSGNEGRTGCQGEAATAPVCVKKVRRFDVDATLLSKGQNGFSVDGEQNLDVESPRKGPHTTCLSARTHYLPYGILKTYFVSLMGGDSI